MTHADLPVGMALQASVCGGIIEGLYKGSTWCDIDVSVRAIAFRDITPMMGLGV